MVLKFPSGRVSVSIQELQEHQLNQPACNICHKRWNWESYGCISDYLCVLHPCQHLVGSGCWKIVPEEQKNNCPVYKVKIWCNESVRVFRAHDRVGLEFDKKVREEIEIGWNEEMIVKKKMKEGLKPVDVAAILYYMHLRDRLESVKEKLAIFLASSTEALTELHLERLIFFLAHMPQYEDDSHDRKVAIALYAFNISRGTNFSLGDLRMAVSLSEDMTKSLRLAAALKHNVEKAPEVSP